MLRLPLHVPVFKLLLSALAAALILASCTKADVQYGSQFVGNQYTQIVMVDTFTTEVSTIAIDSFISGGTGAALLGSFEDNQFGHVNSESYFQLAQPGNFSSDYITYDSIELVLIPNGTYYGDTTQPVQLNVYQTSQQIKKTNDATFYNVNTIPYSTSALGSKQVIYYPHTTDTIHIRLTDDLGKTLFDLIKSKRDEVASTSNFINYFRGICINSPQANALLLGVKDSVEMRLHYRDITTAIPEDKVASFVLNNSSHQFNHISVSRTGTALSPLAQAGKLASSQTNNSGYIQPITGSVVKIRVPYIRDILNAPNYLKMTKVVLSIKPVAGTYSGYYYLPDSLRMAVTDKNNLFGTDLTYSTGAVQYGQFTRDYLYEENTGYTYDLTSYLMAQAATATNNENGLLLCTPGIDTYTKFDRVIVGDQLNEKGKLKLEIYYLAVQ